MHLLGLMHVCDLKENISTAFFKYSNKLTLIAIDSTNSHGPYPLANCIIVEWYVCVKQSEWRVMKVVG